MKTKLIPILIICLVLIGLGLIAESKDSAEFKNCKDCCNEGNCQNGQGTWTYSNGDKYIGQYLDGKKEGEGTYIFVNGDKYVGEFENDNLNGEGSYTYSDGDRYVGDYDNGLRNGEGVYTYTSGDKYLGEFKDGRPTGIGTFTYTDGENYVGEWKEGKRHGKGIYTFAKGNKLSGQWAENQFKTASPLEEITGKTKEWSTYQGYLNWNEAKAKCASIQMRLPKRRELKKAFKVKLLEPWKTEGTYYWTSDEYSSDSAYYFFVDNGKIESFTKDVARHVRCIR
jgi:hypothetical protein